MKTATYSPVFSFSIFVVSLALAFGLVLVATWADIESAFYGFDRRASAPLPGVSCPILMSRQETAKVSLNYKNTANRKIAPSIKTNISTPALPISTYDSVSIEPGESKYFEWTINQENVDLGRFVFAQVLVYAAYPLPDRTITCGIFVIDAPVTGKTLIFSATLLSLLGMFGSVYLLGKARAKKMITEMTERRLKFLSVIMVIGMVASYFGWWIPALGILVLSVITIATTINTRFLNSQ